MDKINKEELMKKLNLTEEELEKVAAGTMEEYYRCTSGAASLAEQCRLNCLKKPDTDTCITACRAEYVERLKFCETLK